MSGIELSDGIIEAPESDSGDNGDLEALDRLNRFLGLAESS